MAKLERAMRRLGRRVWDTPIVCAMTWFLFGVVMLFFMLFSPLCLSTRPCNISQLTEKMVLTSYPGSEVPHGTEIEIYCTNNQLVPSHPVLKCDDSVLQPIDAVHCMTTAAAQEAARQAQKKQAEQEKSNSACAITPTEGRTCPAVGTLKILLKNTPRDFCYSYWEVCNEVYPLLTGAEHDLVTNECRIYCSPADPYAICSSLRDGECQLNENCIWNPNAVPPDPKCGSYAPILVDETVPLGGFKSKTVEQILRETTCFIAGPECMELRGSCREIDNGEYIRKETCVNQRTTWEKRDSTRFIHWDNVETDASRSCAMGGRWILQRGTNRNGADMCQVVGRQQNWDLIPTYDLGNPFGLTDYNDVTTQQINARAAEKRLRWDHLECKFEANQNNVPEPYIRLVDCSCDRRFCSDRGNAVPNPAYPATSTIRCICTCDEERYGGPRCEQLRCIARTDEIANPHPNGVCKEGRYFLAGEFCTPQCADRFAPTDPGPFECLGDGTWDQAGQEFDCVMTFHSCNAFTDIVNAADPSCEEGSSIKELEYCTPVCELGFEPNPAVPIQCLRSGLATRFECKRPCQQPYVINSKQTGACQKRRRIVGGQICRPDCETGTYAMPPDDRTCQDDGQLSGVPFACLTGDPPEGWKAPGTLDEVVYVSDPDAGEKHFGTIDTDLSNQGAHRRNGTCSAGYTGYPACSDLMRCQVMADVANSADPPCEEGLVVSIQCTPKCLTGFNPDTPKLVCIDNILYPPRFECMPEFAGTCEIMAYTAFGVSGLWVLVLFCLVCLSREKAAPKDFDVKGEMNNYNVYRSEVADSGEVDPLTPKSRKKRSSRGGLADIPEDGVLPSGKSGVQHYDFKSMASRELTSSERQAIIDNRSSTDFFVPESQLAEYMQKKAMMESIEDDEDAKSQSRAPSVASTPSMMSYASYDPQEGLKSPQGYPLQRFKTTKPGYICDACDNVKPKGSVMFSAREESYDVCMECVLKMARGFGTPKDLYLQEQARQESLKDDPITIGISPHEKFVKSAPKREKEETRIPNEKLRVT
ncbi:unnamed protein product [Amoebophrya sp. A120]|nr:unnamed protein product [Amoebophrya sp. A120]|eukprot:GSA120T00007506001.1